MGMWWLILVCGGYYGYVAVNISMWRLYWYVAVIMGMWRLYRTEIENPLHGRPLFGPAIIIIAGTKQIIK